LSYADLVFRNIELLSQSSQDLVCDVSTLVRALNQLDALIEHIVTLTGATCSVDLPSLELAIPDAPQPDQSSSSSSSEEPGCFVTLHVSEVTYANDGYLITITVIAAGCLPLELFVFQRSPSVDGIDKDKFCHAASLADIEEYLAGSPRVGAMVYRLAEVALVFRDLDLLCQALQDLKRDLCLLVDSAAANMVLTESTMEIP
jgi:hypothetical protein